MRKYICGKKMRTSALFLVLMVLMLSSLTGCGKKDGSRYFEIDQEVWRMDEQGEVSKIYGKFDRDYEAGAAGLYDDGDSIYFYIRRTAKTELTRYDKKSGEMTTVHTYEAGEETPFTGAGCVGYGDYLYYLSDLFTGPIVRVSKSDGSLEQLGVTHRYLFASSMFTIADGKIYSLGESELSDGEFAYMIFQYDIKSGELQSFDITETVTEIGSSLSEPFAEFPVFVHFSGNSVFLSERTYDNPKIYRAELGGDLNFEQYAELPEFYEWSQAYISDDAIISYLSDGNRQAYYTLIDKNGEYHKLSQGASIYGIESNYPSITYYPDFCVSPCSPDSDSYCLSDYEGNMVIFELPE